MKVFFKTVGILVPGLCLLHCAEQALMPGGDTTFDDRTSSAFENPAANLIATDLDTHFEGDASFDDTFVTAPAPVNPGLGPNFNNTSCGACHLRNGRGLALVGNNGSGSQLLIRVTDPSGKADLPGGAKSFGDYGTQLQDHAIFGEAPEATIEITWNEIEGEYVDGEKYSLRKPTFSIILKDGSAIPTDILTSARIPPPVFGLGLLEAIPSEEITKFADAADTNGDGISGRPNYVWDVEEKKESLGRFGWKASNPTLRQQAAGAYNEDMGVSNPVFPESSGADIEEKTLVTTTFYTQSLAVPRHAPSTQQSEQGENLFSVLGCNGCHVPIMQTGNHSLTALKDQLIQPYTDLLLHDMGDGLADGREDFQASGSEWRTPPLWGIGLTQTVAPDATFLHDGRARTLEEAILWHDGEAKNAKEHFRALPKSYRDALISFLQTL